MDDLTKLHEEIAKVQEQHGLDLVDSQNVVMLRHRFNATSAQVGEFIDLCRLVNHANVYDFVDKHKLDAHWTVAEQP